MQVILVIGLIVLAIFLLFVVFRHFTTKKRIKNAFIDGNVVVSGRKRYGKDILFQAVIKWRKEPYFANYSYGGEYTHIDLKELELTPNTYDNFIDGKIEKVKKNNKLEGKDIYISDGGIYLPSQADSKLHKTYPSLPITYALTGHLWANGIHVNTQRLERLWKALREQADYFVRIRKRVLKLPFIFVVFTTEYDKYESAKQELLPLGSRLFNKYSKAEKDKFRATNGFIKNGFVIVPKHYCKYDSRAFHEIMFGEKAPKKEKFNVITKIIAKFKEGRKATRKQNQRDEKSQVQINKSEECK